MGRGFKIRGLTQWGVRGDSSCMNWESLNTSSNVLFHEPQSLLPTKHLSQ